MLKDDGEKPCVRLRGVADVQGTHSMGDPTRTSRDSKMFSRPAPVFGLTRSMTPLTQATTRIVMVLDDELATALQLSESNPSNEVNSFLNKISVN